MSDEKKLTILNGRLRVSSCGGPLVLSPKPGTDKPCCCCPEPPTSCCVYIFKVGSSAPDGEMSLSGTYYALLSCSGGFEKSELNCNAGFPKCIVDDYNVSGYVRAGSAIDDYGSIGGQDFDTHRPCCFDGNGNKIGCPPGQTETITYITEDSDEFSLSFEELDCENENQKRYAVAIPWTATSSNCGPPTGISATVCLIFKPKDEE